MQLSTILLLTALAPLAISAPTETDTRVLETQNPQSDLSARRNRLRDSCDDTLALLESYHASLPSGGMKAAVAESRNTIGDGCKILVNEVNDIATAFGSMEGSDMDASESSRHRIGG